MKPKLRIVLVLLAVLALVIILIMPMAPIWRKLGLQPKCIQGRFPDLEWVACPGQAGDTAATVTMPNPSVEGLIPIIVDDDGSPDGMIALLYFLRHPAFDVRAVTISYGEAHPEVFAPQVTQVLAAFGRTDIPVGYGSDSPLSGENAFPDSWRQASDEFWGISVPSMDALAAPVPAEELIVNVVSESTEPVTLFVSGAHTNLASALRMNPGIAANIRAVYVMGGAVNVPGNIHKDYPQIENEVAEWNIWVDPLAASDVFASGLEIHLVPLDATNQVTWGKSDLPGWRRTDAPESGLAVDLIQMTLDAWGVEEAFVWDLVAAIAASWPETCPETRLPLDVVTLPGPEQGRTVPVEQAENIYVCLDPDPAKMKAAADAVFQKK